MTTRRFIRSLAVFSLLLVMAACTDSDYEARTTLSGRVLSGDMPIADANVTLYRAGAVRRSDAVILGTGQTDANGFFEITYIYIPPEVENVVLYLIADGPQASTRLASVIGAPPPLADIVINERTTVASAYAMAQFIDGDTIGGTYPGLQNAAAIVRNLVDIYTGDVSSVLGRFPNGPYTSARALFNSLANMLAGCVQNSASCSFLFNEATPAGGVAPDNVLQAVENIAHYPGNNAASLFAVSQTHVVYEPDLTLPPDAWTLAIMYDGNGEELDGPGNIAFDKDGNAWVNNNYTFSLNASEPNTCGDDHLLKLTPTGEDVPGAPYQGGGLYGSGYGIIVDLNGDVWATNFGFQGSECTEDVTQLWNSVSKFSSEGVPISPTRDGDSPGGYFLDDQAQPQGIISDRAGNIWIANCGSDSVTMFPGGDVDQRVVFADFGVEAPFDVAPDINGNVWVTSNHNNSVFQLDPNGNVIASVLNGEAGINMPMGIASDSLGNVWVANSGIVDAPCGDTPIQFPPADDVTGEFASVTMIQPNGEPTADSPYKGGGLRAPWGIAVDGNDNVWVANFVGQRVSQICGARPSNCPPGLGTGDPISPETGYSFNGLVRNTGVQIDPSGNVWLTNNWERIPKQTNPGGHQMVVFIGLAEPVKTPLIGYPERP